MVGSAPGSRSFSGNFPLSCRPFIFDQFSSEGETISQINALFCRKAESAKMEDFETGAGRKFQYHPGKNLNFFCRIKGSLKVSTSRHFQGTSLIDP